MGLLDGLFLAKDLIASGINAFKASERLEELVGQSIDYYDGVLTEDNKALYAGYKTIKAKQDAIENIDEQNAMTEDVEKAMVAFLVSVSANSSVSEKFRSDVRTAIAEWQKSNDAPDDIFEKYMMKQAKTEEEREAVRQIMEEIAKDEE